MLSRVLLPIILASKPTVQSSSVDATGLFLVVNFSAPVSAGAGSPTATFDGSGLTLDTPVVTNAGATWTYPVLVGNPRGASPRPVLIGSSVVLNYGSTVWTGVAAGSKTVTNGSQAVYVEVLGAGDSFPGRDVAVYFGGSNTTLAAGTPTPTLSVNGSTVAFSFASTAMYNSHQWLGVLAPAKAIYPTDTVTLSASGVWVVNGSAMGAISNVPVVNSSELLPMNWLWPTHNLWRGAPSANFPQWVG